MDENARDGGCPGGGVRAAHAEGSGRIGSFLVASGRPAGNSRKLLEQVVRLLSSTTAELCEREARSSAPGQEASKSTG